MNTINPATTRLVQPQQKTTPSVAEIKNYQENLKKQGLLRPDYKPSGKFDKETKEATQLFQRYLNQKPDGILSQVIIQDLSKLVKDQRIQPRVVARNNMDNDFPRLGESISASGGQIRDDSYSCLADITNQHIISFPRKAIFLNPETGKREDTPKEKIKVAPDGRDITLVGDPTRIKNCDWPTNEEINTVLQKHSPIFVTSYRSDYVGDAPVRNSPNEAKFPSVRNDGGSSFSKTPITARVYPVNINKPGDSDFGTGDADVSNQNKIVYTLMIPYSKTGVNPLINGASGSPSYFIDPSNGKKQFLGAYSGGAMDKEEFEGHARNWLNVEPLAIKQLKTELQQAFDKQKNILTPKDKQKNILTPKDKQLITSILQKVNPSKADVDKTIQTLFKDRGISNTKDWAVERWSTDIIAEAKVLYGKYPEEFASVATIINDPKLSNTTKFEQLMEKGFQLRYITTVPREFVGNK